MGPTATHGNIILAVVYYSAVLFDMYHSPKYYGFGSVRLSQYGCVCVCVSFCCFILVTSSFALGIGTNEILNYLYKLLAC